MSGIVSPQPPARSNEPPRWITEFKIRPQSKGFGSPIVSLQVIYKYGLEVTQFLQEAIAGDKSETLIAPIGTIELIFDFANQREPTWITRGNTEGSFREHSATFCG
ncbi:hypothetical protein [Gemmata massiliana]|uniref:hypothetical protein n=1 Tax=Gemmata massiliana TaxID=1210884 RepID=UPI0013A6F80F|nr:hypothetical protein [Gemmata massiliana]